MAWLFWLSGPVVAGGGAALWAWWVGRPKRQPGAAAAVQAHVAYLDALERARPRA